MKFREDQAVEILRQTPYTLQRMLEPLSPEWTASSGDKENWGPYDVIGHLIHGEETDWIPRAEIILADGENRNFVPFDRLAQFGKLKRQIAGRSAYGICAPSQRQHRKAHPLATDRRSTRVNRRSSCPGRGNAEKLVSDVGRSRPEPHPPDRHLHGEKIRRKRGRLAEPSGDPAINVIPLRTHKLRKHSGRN